MRTTGPILVILLEVAGLIYATCPDGWYGADCTLQCHCADGVACDVTGSCPGACAPGWQGATCSQACESGRFGEDCTGICNCYENGNCRPDTGICTDGVCNPGYDFSLDYTCQTQCRDGMFGLYCDYHCHCANSDTCDKVNGTCTDGPCTPGYTGFDYPACQTECKSGWFGMNCAYECHCYYSTDCNKRTGRCSSDTCESGYGGPLDDLPCQTPCEDGTYGTNCVQTCHCLNSSCDPVNGHCDNGVCAPGYQSAPLCQQRCYNNFGQDCEYQCHCAHSSDCDAETGQCSDNYCDYGYDDPFGNPACQTRCVENERFGRNCEYECHCAPGYTCEMHYGCYECSDGWTNPMLCQDVKEPPWGVIAGSIVLIVVLAVALIGTIILYKVYKANHKKVYSDPVAKNNEMNQGSTVL